MDKSRVLGQGACGSVYFGWQSNSKEKNQYLAIKEIPISASTVIYDSMLTEINLLRQLDQHPNIVGFIDAIKTKEYTYLILEFCNDGTLEETVEKHNLSESETLGKHNLLLAELIHI